VEGSQPPENERAAQKKTAKRNGIPTKQGQKIGGGGKGLTSSNRLRIVVWTTPRRISRNVQKQKKSAHVKAPKTGERNARKAIPEGSEEKKWIGE